MIDYLVAIALTVTVTGVHDGDTVTVVDKTGHRETVRLEGIDAPELAQPYGKESRERLKGLICGKTVKLDTVERDRYGRLIGSIRYHGDVNLKMVRSGSAWWYKQYAPDLESYRRAEARARQARRGLWREAAPVAPWVFRQEQKKLREIPAPDLVP